MRDVNVIVVQGKTRPVGIFEILDYRDKKPSRTSWIA